MRQDIFLPYGRVRFGSFGKKECSKKLGNEETFPKSPRDWFLYTEETVSKQLQDPSLQIHSLNQVHGDTIIQFETQTSVFDGIEVKEGDGLFSYEAKQVLVVRTADCVPVFIYSTVRPFVSILHSGWKGTQFGITEKMIEFLLTQGFHLDELRFELGPYIQRSNYEVGEDVAYFFKELGKEVCLPKEDGKYLLDVGLSIAKRVKLKFGDAIQIVNGHTNVYQSPLYFSHRAKEEGRNLNFILWES